MTKWAGKLAVGAAAVLLLGACAGDAEDDTPGGARGRYIEQADPICAQMLSKIGTLGDDPLAERDAARDGLDRLRALGPPKEEGEKLEVFLVELNNISHNLEDVDQSRRVNDQARANTALSRARETVERAGEAADKYGFSDEDGCAGFGT